MINNINTYSGNYALNSSTSTSNSSEIEEIIGAHKKQVIVDETASNSKENLYLSSRSKKINALSTEFFNNGAMDFKNVNQLKDRAYELGLISKQDYDRLTDTDVTEPAVNIEENSQTLASFSANFVNRLEAVDSDEIKTDNEPDNEPDNKPESIEALKKALTTAHDILSDIDSAKNNPEFKDSLSLALSSLKETIHADSFEILPIDDKVGISKVYQVLEIIDKTSPKRMTNAKVDRYIQVLFE